MNHLMKAMGLAALACALVACGGGGDSNGASNSNATQQDVRNVATLGAAAITLGGTATGRALPFLGGYLQGLSTDAGGSRSGSGSCLTNGNGKGSGTFNVTVTKSAVRTGFAVGDRVTTTFFNCDFGGLGLVLNGTSSLTAQSPVANLPTDNYDFNYEANLSSFSIRVGSVTNSYNGVINANSKVTANNAFVSSFAVPAGQTFSLGFGTFNLNHAAGATFVLTDVTTPNSATRKLDGRLTYAINGGSVTLVVSSPAPLTGTNTASGFVPTAGTVNATYVEENLTVSVGVSGNTTTVRGDSDRNGSLDLVFTTTWQGLQS